MTRKYRPLFLVVLIALAAGSFLLLRPGAIRRAGAETAEASLTQATQTFGVFGHATTADDALPSGSQYSGGTSRAIGSPGRSTSAWAVLTDDDQLCVVVDGSSEPASGEPAACNDEPTLLESGQLLVLAAGAGPAIAPGSTTPPAPQLLAGLVPNGVSAVTVAFEGGAQMTAPVVNNGFEVSTGGKAPSGFTWQTSDGASHSERAGP